MLSWEKSKSITVFSFIQHNMPAWHHDWIMHKHFFSLTSFQMWITANLNVVLMAALVLPTYFLSFNFLFFFLLTGTLWNLSSYEPLKMVIINHGLQTMTNEVIIPHSGWEHEPNEDSKPRDAEWTTVFKNTSGCLRLVYT